jgi:hypothetical protein
VCDDSFSTLDATVACKQLGYPTSYVSYKGSAYFGQGSGNILMDEVACTGSEANIGQCPHLSSHNCAHSEDVGVICSSFSPPSPPPRPPRSPPPPLPPPFQATNINARLVNVTSAPGFYSGRLEVWSDSSGA